MHDTTFDGHRRVSTLIGLSLLVVMLATRFHHFGDALHLPDASWALFFLAGFYLARVWLPVLLLAAVAIDVAAVGWMGVSGYCLTPAYAALQLAHLALWAGGRMAREIRGIVAMAAVALAATGLAFVLSNGTFYWFGGRVAEPNWAQFAQTFVDYAPAFLTSTLVYLGVAAAAHALAAHLAPSRFTGLHAGR